jgi:hypothetical protein
VGRISSVLVCLALAGRIAHADPDPAPTPTPVDEQVTETHPVASLVTLGAAYTVFAGWMYVAWYRNHRDLSSGFKWGGDGWLGSRTYAGGADKFGHAWSTMALARGGTELLHQWGGFHTLEASLISTALSEALFIGVEVRDGFTFEFSFSDLTGDTLGALAALALSNFPRLDELFDFRVQYFPSSIYLRKLDGSSPCPEGGCSRWNIAEDYSGQTYLLALHLGGIHALRDQSWGWWANYVDVVAGFGTRDYKPPPDSAADPRQRMFIGLSLNAQGVFDRLFDRGAVHKITHGVFEVFNLPYTSVPLLEYDNRPTGPVMGGGA